MAPDPAEPARQALAAIDALLAEKPRKVGIDFSQATRRIVAFRDALIVRNRCAASGPDQTRLEKANAVLAAIIGGHFPLGDVPWGHIEKARDQLAAIAND